MRDLAYRILFALCLALAVPLAAQAQDSAAEISQEAEDDKGFITSFLEEKLSGAGRSVVIDGFQGALSSRATFDRMTISDDDGVWLTLEGGAMQWTRSALLGRRVMINELSAERIILPRLPGAGKDAAPQAEATEFSLPELPVSVAIEQIAVERVELGAGIIGQEAVLAINGAMNLADGEGSTKLTIDRVDGPRGQFALETDFSNETRMLNLDLTLDEDADGLFSNIVKLHGRPAVQAAIKGQGPLSDFSADISLATDGQPRVTGAVAVMAQERGGAPGTGFRAELGGDVAALAPPQHKAFFGGQSQLLAEGWRGDDGRLLIPSLNVTTQALKLDGNLATTGRGAPESVHLTLLLGEDAGATQLPALLPWADKPTTVQTGNLRLDYEAAQGSGWALKGVVGDISRDDISLSELELGGRGRVVLTDEQALSEIRGWIAFGMTDLEPADPAQAQALGDTLNGGLNFAFSPGNALKFWGMNINGDAFRFTGETEVAGLATGITLSGNINAEHRDLSRFSALAGRDLSGTADMQIKGNYALLGKGFDIEALVQGNDIGIGQDHADRMLAGQSRIALSARRDRTGINLRNLTVNARNLTAQAQGRLDSNTADLTALVEMPDLSVADPAWTGAFRTEARVSGPNGQRAISLNGTAADVALGIAELDGVLAGETTLLVEALENAGTYNVQQFQLTNPQVSATGSGNFSAQMVDGRLNVSMPDLTVLGRGLSGALTAQATASQQGATRRIELTGLGTDLRLGQQDVNGALPGNTELTLTAEEENGDITIETFDLKNDQMLASAQGRIGRAETDLTGRVDIRSLASFGKGWRGALQAQGAFRGDGSGARLLDVTGTARDLSFGQAQVDGALAGETELAVKGVERDGVFTIETARVANPRLNLSADGRVGQGATDVAATLQADDLRFLGRGFRGALNASGRVADQPQGGRTITAQGNARGLAIGNPQADAVLAGETSLDLTARQLADGSLKVDRLRAGNGQFSVTGDGSPTEGLNLDARLNDLGLVARGFPGAATLGGTIRNTGTSYDVNLTASGPGGSQASATGSVATDLSSADLRISGSSDAAAANPFLRTRSVEGPLNFDLRINGRPGLESLSGRVALSGGRLAEPRFGLRIDDLNANADFNGGRIDVDVRGGVAAGGVITVTGPVNLTGDRSMNLDVQASDVVLRDPSLYEVNADARINVAGQLGEGPLVSGRIDVARAELRIPSTGLGGAKSIPDIRHLSDRPPQRQTRAKAGLLEFSSQASRDAGMAAPPATPPAQAARFELLLSAPDQVFVRGRGVDAELGGEIRLTGDARQPIPIGQLELIRGRVALLGKRFDLTEGLIEMQGSLIPVIRLVAQTLQDGITTRIIIDGEARDPEITFEASPEMPEEEVLSQLLFGRGLDKISPLQAAQLASAVATLAGRGGDGIVGRLRASTGLDDLDLTTDDEGNVSVRAGKYLTENVYTDVQVGADGKTRLNLNLDMSDTLTTRGSVDSEGESTIGLFYERDY
ncbi:autotransporter secretion inner membrane protein TamB [Paracoccus halophilus]|uniref:Autotransporter secretion inner membrane protein TamB n=1 Tax=Paracoccus halophilus TaxID=376733 RepID=A0A099EYQ1_9RHOB|nr:translocation/assembly module TamB domain-containing protein [Paracoccus halophilus]KGJ03364.1 hypothetical protein IT41_14455 [Paracoccus halophilus]SFA58878.1 autotransporter secretion inner membrane protein TamB [Paracoccus halophilus]